MKLTLKAASELAPHTTLKDHVVRGLELRARASAKTWHLYYRHEGRERRPKIGAFPGLTIEGARAAAKVLLERVARGEDISAERQERRASANVRELAGLYLAYLRQRMASGNFKQRSFEEAERHINLHILPQLGYHKARDVRQTDVAKLLAAVGAHAPVTSNRVRATLSAMFKLAEHPDNAIRPQNSNPVHATETFREFKRRRHASVDECKALADALAQLSHAYPAHVAAILCILYAGTRLTELVQARKSEMYGATIVLQRHKTERTGEDRTIHLPRQAQALISRLPDDGSDYLFGRALAELKEPKRAIHDVWARARDIAGVEGLQARDLRRTFASVAFSSGAELHQIGEIFGHTDTDTTARYAWLYQERAKALVQGTADTIEGMLAIEASPPATALPCGGNDGLGEE